MSTHPRTRKRSSFYILVFAVLFMFAAPMLHLSSAQGTLDAMDDYYTLLNNESQSVDAPGVLENDSSGAAILTFDSQTSAGNSVTVNTDGSISLASAGEFIGTATFTYTVSDGAEAQDTATVTITYEGPPPPPTPPVDAVDDNFVLLNDTDHFIPAPGIFENDVSAASLVTFDTTTTAGNSIVVNADGSVQLSSANDYVGIASFTYTIADDAGTQDTATVSITYEAPPAPLLPEVEAGDNTYTLTNNQEYYFDVPGLLENDTPNTFIVEHEINTLFDGTGYVNSDGGWYIPNAGDFVGTVSFTYTIEDANGTRDTATVFLTYEAAQPIVTLPDFFTTVVDTPLQNKNVLDNDTGTGLTVIAFSTPELGIDADGTLYYYPPPGFIGSFSFPYQVQDALGNQAEDTVNITVEAAATGCGYDIPQSECDTLINLYNSTNGPAWTNNTGWTSTNSPCSWYGVFCEGGHISSIALQNNQLNGTLPALPLPSLTYLDLSYNQLTGTIPSLPASLQYLSLQTNQLTGSIPTLPSSLVELNLNTNQLTGAIPAFPAGLKSIYAFGNQLTGTIPTFPASLQSVELSSNQLTGTIPALPASLLSLSLANNQLTGSIPALPASLESIIVRSNQLSGTIPTLPASLLALGLSDNQLTGTIPPLPPSLQDLSLRDNQLSGPIPTLPPTLYFLWLHNNHLSGEIPTSITSTAIVAGDNLRLCGGANDLYSSDAAVNAFIEALKPGWSPLNRCIALNQLPTANAGDDQNITDGDGNGTQAVSLNGSLSVDPDGSITGYSWSANGFEIATGVTPTLNLSVGLHTITLTVTDNSGGQAADTVVIEIAPNQLPTANAGADQTVSDSDVNGTQAVTLTGALSTDPDGSITGYSWSANGFEIATGVTPTLNLSVGIHTITLTVTDNVGGIATDTVTIEVILPPNRLPVANAGPDQTVTDSNNNGSEIISLNGSLSSDPDGTLISYSWSENGSAVATGLTPMVNLVVGVHVITLSVTDNRGGTATDTVTINVAPLNRIGCSFQTQIPVSECTALVNLYNSTNGPGWINKTGWTLTNTPCSWTGIFCFSGHVTNIILPSNNLRGTLPALPSFVRLINFNDNRLSGGLPAFPSTLLSFDAASNQLTGTIPSLPSNMYYLGLSNNRLTSRIPNFPATMAVVNLADNQLTGPIPSLSATVLRELTLRGNRLNSSLPAFPSTLVRFDAAYNQLTGTIPTLPSSMYYLWLSNNQLTGRIPNFPATMGVVNLADNQLSGPIPSLPTSMIHLKLFNNRLSGEIPVSILLTNIQVATPQYAESLRICGTGNNLYSTNPPVNNFIAARMPGWSPNNGCFANQLPAANAGADQTVTDSNNSGSENIALNGSLSSDPDGTIVSYSWSDNSSQITTGATPTVNLAVGVHVITLRVTDNRGGTATDTVTIIVNAPPNANAGPDRTVIDLDNSGGQIATLNGSLSSAPDGTIVSYLWSENGSQIATGATPTVYLTVGVHVITLRVTDNRGGTATDTVTITVNAPPSSNAAPQLTIAANSIIVRPGSLVINVGSFADPNLDSVTIRSSRGSIAQTNLGNGIGLWVWTDTVSRNALHGSFITVTITATDSWGAVTTRSFDLLVRAF